jgi:hypothetical protein
MMAAIQGIIAAGTVAHLTREATWEKIAFTSNHLFYLVGIASHAAAVEIPYFSFAAKAIFMLTPIVLIESFRQGQVSTPKSELAGYYVNRFYYAAAVVSTLVLVALGHTAYGVGFFSVMALDRLSRSEKVNAYVKTAFEWSANGTALLTFASYAVKLATPQGQYVMGVTATLVFLPRIFKMFQEMALQLLLWRVKFPPQVFTSMNGSQHEETPIYPWSSPWQMRFARYTMAPVGFISSYPVRGIEPGVFIRGLQNQTGKLPHDL